MNETIEHIKKFNIGDAVTSTHSILLDRGFRGVTGTIKSIVKGDFGSWQYLIQLDDGRELQCDDWHLEQSQLNDNQKSAVNKLQKNYAWFEKSIEHALYDYLVDTNKPKLNNEEFAQVMQVFMQNVTEREERGN